MDKEKENFWKQSDPMPFEEFMEILISWLDKNVQGLEGLSYEFINVSPLDVDHNELEGNPVNELSGMSLELQPFIDLIETDEHIYFTSDLRLDREMVSYEITNNRIRIDIAMEDRMQTLYVGLPSRFDHDIIEASFSNGVLDLVLKKIR